MGDGWPDIQLHRPKERADRARVFLVRMQDPTLLHQSVTPPPELWPLAPRNPPTLAITHLLLAKPPSYPFLASLHPSLSFLKDDQVIECAPAWINQKAIIIIMIFYYCCCS